MGKQVTWGVALFALTLFAVLTQLSFQETAKSQVLGISATSRNGAAIVSYVLPDGIAWNSGIRPGDRLVAVNGEPVGAVVPRGLNTAQSFAYVTADGHPTLGPGPNNLPAAPATRAAFVFIAAAFALLGGVVLVLTDGAGRSWIFFAWAFLTAVSLVSAIGETSGSIWPIVLEVLAVAAFGASTAALFFVFPTNWLRLGWTRFVLGPLELLHALAAAGFIWSVVRDPALYDVVQKAIYGLLGLDILAAIVSTAVPLIAAMAQRKRPPPANAVLLAGAACGLGPLVLLALLPQIFGLGYLQSPSLAILPLALLPLSLAATMGHGQTFGIRHWVRRGLIRLFVWSALVIVYGMGLMALQRNEAAGGLPLRILASPFAVVLIIAFTAPRLERLWRERLEAALLQDVYSLPRALQTFTAKIAEMRTPNEVSEFALSSLGETLDLEWAALALFEPDARSFTWGARPSGLEWAGADPGMRSPADAAGTVTAEASILTVPLLVAGSRVGLLALGPKAHDKELGAEDRLLIATVAPLLAICFQLARQLEIGAEREAELRHLNQRLVDVEEEARRTLALEVHDDALQRAVLLSRELEDACRELPEASRWSAALTDIVVALRSFCVGLYPTILEDFGLPAGLEQLANDLRSQTDTRAEVSVQSWDGSDFGRLDRALELALYRVAQEALNNVRKHAAAGNVQISLLRHEAAIELAISDDGAPPTRSEQLSSGLGLAGMRHRLARWDGQIRLSNRAQGGTEVRAGVTLARSEALPA